MDLGDKVVPDYGLPQLSLGQRYEVQPAASNLSLLSRADSPVILSFVEFKVIIGMDDGASGQESDTQ